MEISQRGLCCIFRQSCVMPCLCRGGSSDGGGGLCWWGGGKAMPTLAQVRMVRMGPSYVAGVLCLIFADFTLVFVFSFACTAKETGFLHGLGSLRCSGVERPLGKQILTVTCFGQLKKKTITTNGTDNYHKFDSFSLTQFSRTQAVGHLHPHVSVAYQKMFSHWSMYTNTRSLTPSQKLQISQPCLFSEK